jgi:hypothetical protein
VIESQQDKKVKNQVETSLRSYKLNQEADSAQNGLLGSQRAKERLLRKMRNQEKYIEDSLDFMIKNESDALHAMNLHKLLTKNIFEVKNSYQVMSNIKTDQEKKRLNDLLRK